jgi:membrane-bound serine protease (ClpP class)
MILAIILLGVGLLLVIAEVLFPSFGILSVLAATAVVAAVVVAFRDGSSAGLQFLGVTAVLVPVTIMLGLKLFPKSPFGRRMVAEGLSFESQRATDRRDLDLVGAEGTVEGPCRPAGMARIGGRRVDVVTRGEFLDEGTRVRVLEVLGNRVVVVRADEGEPLS